MHGGIHYSPETKVAFKVIYYSYILGFCFTGLIFRWRFGDAYVGDTLLLSIPDVDIVFWKWQMMMVFFNL